MNGRLAKLRRIFGSHIVELILKERRAGNIE
jgi:hypothetical protein